MHFVLWGHEAIGQEWDVAVWMRDVSHKLTYLNTGSPVKVLVLLGEGETALMRKYRTGAHHLLRLPALSVRSVSGWRHDLSASFSCCHACCFPLSFAGRVGIYFSGTTCQNKLSSIICFWLRYFMIALGK